MESFSERYLKRIDFYEVKVIVIYSLNPFFCKYNHKLKVKIPYNTVRYIQNETITFKKMNYEIIRLITIFLINWV